MSEELLRAVIKLFAIVARERITDAERENISEFLLVHLNQESVGHYLRLFDKYVAEYKVEKKSGLDVDDETLVFVDEWSNIIKISKEVNKSLTITQKLILVIKIIELIYSGGEISERQENLMFYIAEALKLSKNQLDSLRGFVTGEDYEDLSAEDMLIIDEGSGQSAVAGPVMTAKNLTGIIAILRIPDIETYFIKYLGISTLYLNGIPFRSRTIDMFPTGSTIRGNKIKTIYYSDVINRFLMSEEMSRVTFSAEHIFYHFRSGKAGLQNIHFSEEGGKLIGLMGASGSGKSTLLNVLNGSERPSSGRVIINGVNVHDEPEKMEGVVGFVPQDDLLIAELTVFENLNFAAKLTFKDNTKEENAVLVGRILQSLGLSETAHLKVGSAFDKTISGGQRKRLNIALELLREPAVLFVDEPTSGLSSRDSENIMDLLKELSFKGKMIFVVIHQPSSDIFKMFDSLLILDAGGLEIYYGNPVEAVVYFKEIINAANKTQGGCPECGNINPEQVFDIIETRIVNEYGRLTQVRKVSPGQWYQYFKDNIKLPKIKHSREPLEVTQKIPGKLRQAGVFFHRDVKSKLSNKQYLAITLMEAPFLAFFMAYMVRYYATLNVDEPVYSFFKNSNIPVYFFMSIIVALFMGLTVSAEEIFRDRMILKRERFLNLSKFSYLLSKVLVLFIVSAIQTASFVIIGDLVLEIHGVEPGIWALLFSTSCFANVLGLNISASFNSAVAIYIIIPLLLIPQLLLSGVVVDFDKFNPKVSNFVSVPFFGEIMASRWAFEAAMVTQFKNNPYSELVYGYDREIALADYKKIYYLPAIETELDYCLQNTDAKFTRPEEFTASLNIVRTELQNEMRRFGQTNDSLMQGLTLKAFDYQVYQASSKVIETLKQVYKKRRSDADLGKDQVLKKQEAQGVDVSALRKRYMNEEVIESVINTRDINRVVKIDGQLIQKVYPVYGLDRQPAHYFDFRTGFYAPEKYFMGKQIDTLYFNLAMIWFMTLVFCITLYFDVLKKVVAYLTPGRVKKKNRKHMHI